MFQFKRNQVIVTVLVFMIAIAAYLSLTEAPSSLTVPEVAENEATIDIADAEFDRDFFDEFGVMETLPPDSEDGLIAVEVSNPDATVGQKEVVIAKKDSEQQNVTTVDSKNVDVSYFAEEKMLREQARAKQIEALNEYVADPNLDKDAKSKAANDLLTIQERIEKETGAESLLRAKGFKDVFVRMDEDTVDVVVNKEEALTDAEIAQIEEIVQRKTGYTVGQIKISCLKVNNQTANK
ncbi:SpoIIIAH-like family protein [Niameybacter massiliensis]|uniref:SpoIIIAH-like family protein n=1 Tax=Holtiella tumoricola TaxID=3018743 RepID=A0AA42DR11_9FIRM|nr:MULTISPECIES: SpoIIIAH-like family protein [Lachnospirales]MDA3733769.1 SpoIIIAH-like family protein [Holtiella tumoricola]